MRVPAIRFLPTLVLFLGSHALAQPVAPIDSFLCAKAVTVERFVTIQAPSLADQFVKSAAAVQSPRRLCAPVSLDGDAPADASTHLVAHALRDRAPRARRRQIVVENELGTQAVEIGKAAFLLAPSAVDPVSTPPALDPGAHSVDTYRCYKAQRTTGGTAPGAELLATLSGGGARRLELRPLRHLCAPLDVGAELSESPRWHLACYDVRPATLEDRAAPVRGLHVNDAFGAAELDTTADQQLCVPSRAVQRCNGATELCDRRYDQVSYATTHNAMSNDEDSFAFANQYVSVPHQLEGGVRGLMLDTHYDEGIVALCHAVCVLGKRPLADGLVEIRAFLERNPHEVVTIIFESYVTAADTEAAFAAAGLLPYVHSQPVGSPWPTLREMIDADRRLVVFTDNQGGAFPWYHHVWSYAFETHYSFGRPEAMSCNPNRGSPSNSLFILNHFLTRVFGSVELAEMVNHNPFFIQRARACQAANSRLPNFVTVDFFDIGDVRSVVDNLNGL